MFGKKKTNKKFADAIIMNDERVSVEGLRKKAKHANTRFWGIAVSMGMVSSLVLPYMSMAAVAPSSSNVFTGEVIPGYSMGGVTLAAYGVDVNSWGKVTESKVVGSNYGVWSSARLTSAQGNVLDTSHLENSEESANVNLSTRDKAVGWQGITGRMAYTTTHPDGQDSTNASNQYDSVAPYRTISDYNYWDNRILESNGAASAGINVSLYADFIIVSLDAKGNVHVLESPDAVNTDGTAMLADKNPNGGTTTIGDTTATPYYIPISTLMDAYGITDSKNANISNLMSKIADGGQSKFKQVVTASNNLLEGTSYKNVNSGGGENSTAFNPYPYSMAFSMETDNGTIVSSIYDNSECYVYFSPSSVYTQYMALKAEYESLMNSALSTLEKDAEGSGQDPATVFQMGYYLAEMSILEAYLNEALPQDMTRGYVGPTECTDLVGPTSSNAGNGNPQGTKASDFATASKPEDLNQVSYISLMYDFSHMMSEGQWNTSAAQWRQTETDAIMESLSTFGYYLKNAGSGSEDAPKGTGVMKGINALHNLRRPTLFGVFQRGVDFGESGSPDSYVGGDQRYAGMYVPTYFPIQQHKMPDSEKVYRFQILSAIPYDTLLEYIKNKQFSANVKFSFTSANEGDTSGIESFDSITVVKAQDKLSALAYQYEHEEEEAYKTLQSLSDLNTNIADKLSVLGGTTSTEDSNAARVDAALYGYSASNMNSDNVHDLFDVIRGVNSMKFETWNRYYNPIKSSGGDNDIFLTRISPAVTTYFPAILVNGYTPAGGDEISSALTPYGASFDYFSIPSFAPCFAAHTADTSYYGVLNYELRPFYSVNFIKTLSSSANVPAVEAYEAAQEEVENLKQEQEDEAQITDKNLACLYVLGKRVAYARTVNALSNPDVSITKSELLNVVKKLDSSGVLSSTLNVGNAALSNVDTSNMTEEQKKAFEEVQGVFSSSNEIAFTPSISKINHVEIAELYENLQKDDFPDTIKLHYESEKGGNTNDHKDGIARLNDTNSIDANSWAGRDSFASRTGVGQFEIDDMGMSAAWAEDSDNQAWGIIHRDQDFSPWDGATESRNLMVVKDENCSEDCTNHQEGHYWIPASLFFTAVYDKKFDDLLGEGGTYFWEKWTDIFSKMKNDGVEPEASDEVGYSKAEMGKYNTRFTTTWLAKVAKDLLGMDMADATTTSELIEISLAQMDSASDEIAKDMINLIKDYNMLTSTMPSKMQNCLAWADYQNSTDSEAQYQVDPSNANVVINVGDGQNGQSVQPEHIRSKAEAEKLSLVVDPADDGNGFTISNKNATDENGLGLEGRLERGVEGSTWTSTVHPALYTMSATIARVSSMSTTTGTSYPYSGLANGRLQSGTDKYAVMQAHVIDYTSIASGIAGDLSTRQRAQVVALVEPQYAAVTDLTDIANILGGLMGEIGASMIKGAAGVFSSVQFPSDNSANVATSDNQGMNNGHPASSTMSYMMSDGTTMNRTPAALATFNPNTGKLEYGAVYNNTSSNYILTGSGSTFANAGSNATTVEMAGAILTTQLSSVYKIIQLLALSLVLISIGYIAFKNFWSYSAGKGEEMITSQRQLKTVIWRSIAAVFMIGLPPLAGGTGFEGGNFIVLEVISNVAAFIEQIFVGDNGSAIMSIFTNINLSATFGLNFFAWILYFICCAIMAACFLIGTLFVLILHLFLMIFFLFGPIVWALFVWPYNNSAHKLTGKLNLGFLSGGAIGNLAPTGHIKNFAVFSLISIAWGIMFWIIAQVFVLGGGMQYSDINMGESATLASASGYSQASMAISSATAGIDFFGLPTGAGAELRLWFTTLVCVGLFFLMGFMLVKTIVSQMQQTRGLGHDLWNGIKAGAARAKEVNQALGDLGIRPGNIVKEAWNNKRLPKLGDALDENGSLTGDLAKRHKLKQAQKAMRLGKHRMSDDIRKTLEENGINPDEIKQLSGTQKRQAKKKARQTLSKARKDNRAEQVSEVKKAIKALGIKENGEDSNVHRLKEIARLGNTFAKAALDPSEKGINGLLSATAGIGATLSAANLDKEKKLLGDQQKTLKNASDIVDKMLEEGHLSEDDLNNLDSATFKELEASGLVRTEYDREGKAIRKQTSDSVDKAKELQKTYADKLADNQRKIQAKQRAKDDMYENLKTLNLHKESTAQETNKILKAGFDNQHALQVAQAHGFVDANGRPDVAKARDYINNVDGFADKIDTHEQALQSVMRQQGFEHQLDVAEAKYTAAVASGKMNQAEMDHRMTQMRDMFTTRATQILDAAPAREQATAIARKAPEERFGALSQASDEFVKSGFVTADMPVSERAERYQQLFNVAPPAPHEIEALMQRVSNGTASTMDYAQAIMVNSEAAITGTPIPIARPFSAESAVRATVQTQVQSMGFADKISMGENMIATSPNGSMKVNVPVTFATYADGKTLLSGIRTMMDDMPEHCEAQQMFGNVSNELFSAVEGAVGWDGDADSTIKFINSPKGAAQLSNAIDGAIFKNNPAYKEACKTIQAGGTAFGASSVDELQSVMRESAMAMIAGGMAHGAVSDYNSGLQRNKEIEEQIMQSDVVGSMCQDEILKMVGGDKSLAQKVSTAFKEGMTPEEIANMKISEASTTQQAAFAAAASRAVHTVTHSQEAVDACGMLVAICDEKDLERYRKQDAMDKTVLGDIAKVTGESEILYVADSPEEFTRFQNLQEKNNAFQKVDYKSYASARSAMALVSSPTDLISPIVANSMPHIAEESRNAIGVAAYAFAPDEVKAIQDASDPLAALNGVLSKNANIGRDDKETISKQGAYLCRIIKTGEYNDFVKPIESQIAAVEMAVEQMRDDVNSGRIDLLGGDLEARRKREIESRRDRSPNGNPVAGGKNNMFGNAMAMSPEVQTRREERMKAKQQSASAVAGVVEAAAAAQGDDGE